MEFLRCILLFLIAGFIIVPTPLEAIKRKIKFTKLQLTEPPDVNSPPQSRPGSPVNTAIRASDSPTSNLHPPHSNPGLSGTTGEKLVTPKESFPHLPGTSGTHKSVELRKHSDFPALDGNHPRTVDHNARLSPSLQRQSSLSPQAESVLSNNPFARLPGAQTSNKHVNQPKQSEEFPPLGGSSDRLNVRRDPTLPGNSNHDRSFGKNSLDSLEAQRKSSLHEFPALPGSSHAKNPNNRPSLESLANSQSKLSLDQFPALPSSNNRLHIVKNSPTGLDPSDNPHRKMSLEEFPALPGSSHAKNPNNRPSLESLANSQSKLSLDQFPALPSSNNRLHILKNSPAELDPSDNPQRMISLEDFPTLGAPKGLSKSNSLTLRNTQSSANLQEFVRKDSIDSTRSLRFPSQFNSPLNSPFYRSKDFFGSSSSLSMSNSGSGIHPSSSSGSLSSLNSGRYSPGVGRTRKLSDLAQVPQTPVAVSDTTCKNDTSPAEQCFNYFTFSLFWPPALGYEYKTKKKTVNENINLLKWSIHALWPSAYSGIMPENCKKRTSVSFSQYRFDHEKGLRASLESKWINICPYKLHGSSMVSFWDRQFSKHGACASRSPMIASDVGYFKMAKNLFDDIGIASVLLNIGFEVGTKMNYGDLVDKVNEKIGKRARVEFTSDQNTKELYLKEIKVCYDLQFHRINCPASAYLSTELRTQDIVYLDHYSGYKLFRIKIFSILKRVKTYLRASMGQDRLNALALLSIEAQLIQEIDYDDIIDIFAGTKARKDKFLN